MPRPAKAHNLIGNDDDIPDEAQVIQSQDKNAIVQQN